MTRNSRWTARAALLKLLLAVVAGWGLATSPGSAQEEGGGGEPAVYREWRVYTVADGLPDDSIRAIRVSGDRVWVGTDGGLALLEGERWRSWTEEDGLPCPSISSIDIDPGTRDLWLGTWGEGLARFSGGRFDRFGQLSSGLAGNLVFSVKVAGGRVWAATNGGLSSFDWIPGSWDLLLERRALPPETVLTSLAVVDRHLYGAAWCEGIFRVALSGAGSAAPGLLPGPGGAEEEAPSLEGSATVALTAADDHLWCATRTHLRRRKPGGEWQERRILPAGLHGERIHCIAATGGGEAWLGADGGIIVLTDWEADTWLRYRPAEGVRGGGDVTLERGEAPPRRAPLRSLFGAARVRCIAFGEAGDEVWVGTSTGLARGAGRVPWSAFGSGEVPDSPRGDPAGGGPGGGGLGSGGASAAPAGARAAAIALLGPVTRTVHLPGEGSASARPPMRPDLLAIQLAFDEVNSRRATSGEGPIQLVTGAAGFTRYAWGTPEDEIIDLVGTHQPLALIGSVGPGRRITTAALLRTEVPLLNVSDAPATNDEIDHPWMFRCPIDDPRAEQRIIDHLFDTLGRRRPVILRSGEPYGEMHLDWWAEHARGRGSQPVAELRLPAAGGDLAPILEKLRSLRFDAILTWSDADHTARLLHALRHGGLSQVLVGSDQIVSRGFLEQAPGDAGEVLAPEPCAHRRDAEARRRFAEAYRARRIRARARAGGAPSALAWVAYGAMRHLGQALETSTPARGDFLTALDATAPLSLCRLEAGGWHSSPLKSAPRSSTSHDPRRSRSDR